MIAISEIVSAAQSNGNLVAVKGKIVSKSPPETIYSHTMRKSLNKVDAIVADSTSAIRLTLWQNNIHDLEEGACYLFENLRVSFYQRNYLATTTRTTSKQIEEAIELSEDSKLAVEALMPTKSEIESFIGEAIAAEVTRTFGCLNCKFRTDEQSCGGAVVKCSSCNVSMLKQNMPTHVNTNIIVTKATGECVERLMCPMKVLDSLFSKLAADGNYNISEKQVGKLSSELITETILRLDNVLFSTLKDEKVIQSMDLVTVDDE